MLLVFMFFGSLEHAKSLLISKALRIQSEASAGVIFMLCAPCSVLHLLIPLSVLDESEASQMTCTASQY